MDVACHIPNFVQICSKLVVHMKQKNRHRDIFDYMCVSDVCSLLPETVLESPSPKTFRTRLKTFSVRFYIYSELIDL